MNSRNQNISHREWEATGSVARDPYKEAYRHSLAKYTAPHAAYMYQKEDLNINLLASMPWSAESL